MSVGTGQGACFARAWVLRARQLRELGVQQRHQALHGGGFGAAGSRLAQIGAVGSVAPGLVARGQAVSVGRLPAG